MSQEAVLQPAKEAVLRFAQAWTAWEVEMAKIEEPFHDAAMRQAHAALIADHCPSKRRAYVDGLPTYRRPPTYGEVVDGNIVYAELTAPNKVLVDVRCTLVFYRFVVLRKRDGWRIDGIKWRVVETDEWSNGLIGM